MRLIVNAKLEWRPDFKSPYDEGFISATDLDARSGYFYTEKIDIAQAENEEQALEQVIDLPFQNDASPSFNGSDTPKTVKEILDELSTITDESTD